MYYFLPISYFLCLFLTIYCDLTVEYYKKLIDESTKKALHYTLPQANEEFRIGYESSKIEDFGSYDFIIVGAGSAGSVVATRLSEIASFKILVLEAGGEENDFSLIPNMMPNLQFTEQNWGYYSIPHENCFLGLNDRKAVVPRGKSLGGSSAINALMYTRGSHEDYDKWAELGNPGWSYQEVLPYFLKSENSQIDGDSGYHKTGGFYNVEYAFLNQEKFPSLLQADYDLNMSYVDLNGQTQIGVSKIGLNIIHGKRLSTSTAFLDKARRRNNLKLVPKALATRIIIDKTLKIAQGVEFIKDGKKFEAWARKEVILCGGVINSPQLLMLSGIGPKNHLRQIGIKLIEDLPVGKNLADHVRFNLYFHTNYTAETDDLETQIKDYLKGTGKLTNPVNVIDVLHSGNLSEERSILQYRIFPPLGIKSLLEPRTLNFNDNLVKKFLEKLDPQSDFHVFISLLRPKSRGEVTLKSNSPIDFPEINFNFFSEPDDVENLIEASNFMMKLTQTETFKRINTTFIDFPICLDFPKFSRRFWDCIIRHVARIDDHACETNRMGPNKKSSVVDENLKVHGVKQLRVVDASIFPSTISGNTNAPTVMAAEKISDVIKNDYLYN